MTATLPVTGTAGSGTAAPVHSDEDALGELADTAVLDPSTVRGLRADTEADPSVPGPSPMEIAVRSSRRGLSTSVRVRRVSLDGAVLAEAVLPVELAGPGVVVLAVPGHVGVVEHPADELLVADMDWRRAVWTPLPDQEMHWRPASYTATVEDADDGATLTIAAASLVRDLLVQPDRLSPSGRVDRGFMTLLPGEEVVFSLPGIDHALHDAVVREPVLWTLDRVLGR